MSLKRKSSIAGQESPLVTALRSSLVASRPDSSSKKARRNSSVKSRSQKSLLGCSMPAATSSVSSFTRSQSISGTVAKQNTSFSKAERSPFFNMGGAVT